MPLWGKESKFLAHLLKSDAERLSQPHERNHISSPNLWVILFPRITVWRWRWTRDHAVLLDSFLCPHHGRKDGHKEEQETHSLFPPQLGPLLGLYSLFFPHDFKVEEKRMNLMRPSHSPSLHSWNTDQKKPLLLFYTWRLLLWRSEEWIGGVCSLQVIESSHGCCITNRTAVRTQMTSSRQLSVFTLHGL